MVDGIFVELQFLLKAQFIPFAENIVIPFFLEVTDSLFICGKISAKYPRLNNHTLSAVPSITNLFP